MSPSCPVGSDISATSARTRFEPGRIFSAANPNCISVYLARGRAFVRLACGNLEGGRADRPAGAVGPTTGRDDSVITNSSAGESSLIPY